ncbi:MAG: tetratricopeptide repeat protein [Flavobacteriales bacterium]|nr:tetratricopeptide repeat protein [Flavobacteriales bacterium]
MKIKSIKKLVTLFTALILVGSSFAQSLDEAIRMTENQRYVSAKSAFRKLVKTDPKNGNVYFYFGESYFKQSDSDSNNLDSANALYKTGTEVDPENPLNFVGLGKVLWARNYQNQGEEMFEQALKISKYKSVKVYLNIAENYINAKNKNLVRANELLAKALKMEPKNPEVHILLGDAMLEANPLDGSGPVKKYNDAAELDKTNAKPILRIGKLYFRAKNPTEALKWYKEAVKIDSTFAPAYIEMGELYLMAGFNSSALESYRKYLALNRDMEARERLAQILWVNKFYNEAIEEINEIKQTDSSSLYLYRVLAYSYNEVGKEYPDGYEQGLKAINKFFDMSSKVKGFKYLASDYSVKGKLLSNLGQDSLGMVELKRALSLDSTIIDLYSDIAFAYYKSKNYNEAIVYYTKKVATGKPTVSDYVYLGLTYYQTRQFEMSDSIFKTVCIASPDFIIAHKWRAKANVQLDPDSKKGLAKPHYEKVVELVLADSMNLNRNLSSLIEAYSYLVSYHLIIAKEIDVATQYLQKLEAIDPENKIIKPFYKTLEDLKKKK